MTCITLQHTTTQVYSQPWHTATLCNTLQHFALRVYQTIRCHYARLRVEKMANIWHGFERGCLFLFMWNTIIKQKREFLGRDVKGPCRDMTSDSWLKLCQSLLALRVVAVCRGWSIDSSWCCNVLLNEFPVCCSVKMVGRLSCDAWVTLVNGVLQCVAVYYSVLQSVYCSVLQCVCAFG